MEKVFDGSGSRENSIKKIEQKEIDIENFQGFLLWTQIPNISKILKDGFKPIVERDSLHWKYGGKLAQKEWENAPGIYITAYDSDNHSFKDNNYPWPKAGQVGVLIDQNLDKELFTELKKLLQNAEDKMHIEALYKKNISPKQILGLVFNNTVVQLENPRDSKSVHLPTPEGESEKVTVNQPFNFSSEEYKEMLCTRLKRLIGTEYEDNLVPLYDTNGRIIWPVK